MKSTPFYCSPSRELQTSRRKLGALLGVLALAALSAGVFAWKTGRPLPAILAVLAALLAVLALRMSGDLETTKLWIQGSDLVVQTRRYLLRRPISNASGRLLDPSEIDHLRRLVSAGVFMATSGGFDTRLLGEFDLYATDLENAVLVELDEHRLIVTPDDPKVFLRALLSSPTATIPSP